MGQHDERQNRIMIAAVRESANGTKRTCQPWFLMSAIGGKGDMAQGWCEVRL